MDHATAENALLGPAWETAAARRLAPDLDIEAIVPVYDAGGSATALLLRDGGQKIYPRRVRTLLRHIAGRACRTLPLINAQMHGVFGGRQELPVPISPQLTLIPCKVRVPRVRGDETLGYFSLAALRRIIAQDGGAAMELASGRRVRLLCTIATARSRVLMADYARRQSFPWL